MDKVIMAPCARALFCKEVDRLKQLCIPGRCMWPKIPYYLSRCKNLLNGDAVPAVHVLLMKHVSDSSGQCLSMRVERGPATLRPSVDRINFYCPNSAIFLPICSITSLSSVDGLKSIILRSSCTIPV